MRAVCIALLALGTAMAHGQPEKMAAQMVAVDVCPSCGMDEAIRAERNDRVRVARTKVRDLLREEIDRANGKVWREVDGKRADTVKHADVVVVDTGVDVVVDPIGPLVVFTTTVADATASVPYEPTAACA